MARNTGLALLAVAASAATTAPASAVTVGSADQCKRDGWKQLTRADGTRFTSPGACLAYLQSGK